MNVMLGTILMMLVLSGCSTASPSEKIQDTAFVFSRPPYRCFKQMHGSALHPAAYYTCYEGNLKKEHISSISYKGENLLTHYQKFPGGK